MYQVNATLAIIMSFMITFVDELGEMREVTTKKAILIAIALLVGLAIYRYSNKTSSVGDTMSVAINPKLNIDQKEQFNNYYYI